MACHLASRTSSQVLFIDSNDVLRGRLAAALFERVAEWNGFGRVLLPWTCGVDADQGAPSGDVSTQAALMFRAAALGLRPKAFTKPTERFEAADLDRWVVGGWPARVAAAPWTTRRLPACRQRRQRRPCHTHQRRAPAGVQLAGPVMDPLSLHQSTPTHTRHDVIVALDRATKDAILRMVDPRYRDYYDDSVRLLSEYGSAELLQVVGGGGAGRLRYH